MSSTPNSSKVTAACVVAAMMMMMAVAVTGAAVMPRAGGHANHSARTHKKSDGAAVKTVPVQLDPSFFTSTPNIRPLENASISPWTYSITRDESLFPEELAEARCSLQGCLDSEGVEDLGLESRPIMHQVLLLRRVRSPGAGQSHQFRLESRLIAVGCTCVRPVVQLQQ